MSHYDKTNIGGSGEVFLTTHWSLIDGVGKGKDRDRALVGLLLERYWKPVYCFLRYKGYSNEDAKDLTQAFFHEVVLNRNLISRADASQGHFRTFLLHALDQFLIDIHRKKVARKRIPKKKLVSLELMDPPPLSSITAQDSAEDSFNYSWKSSLIDQALTTTRKDCHERGLQVHWSVFEERVLQPIFENHEAPSMKEICERHGIDSESVASNMLVTVKRRFKAALRTSLSKTVLAQGDVDGELRDLLSLFGSNAQEKD
jgi:RNA polymerase sigma-70 factor (ECF subfamily)